MTRGETDREMNRLITRKMIVHSQRDEQVDHKENDCSFTDREMITRKMIVHLRVYNSAVIKVSFPAPL